MKIKFISLIMLAVIMGSVFFGVNYFNNFDNDVDNSVNVNFSERSYSQEALTEKSDLIVTGKVKELKDKKNILVEKTNNTEANIKWSYSIYKLKIDEVIKGEAIDSIDLVYAGDVLNGIEFSKDYVFFLEKDMSGDNSYHLLSYSQGVFETDGDTLVNKNTNQRISKESLKNIVQKK